MAKGTVCEGQSSVCHFNKEKQKNPASHFYWEIESVYSRSHELPLLWELKDIGSAN